jgi:sulfane dehydrogenase subunit SoxC
MDDDGAPVPGLAPTEDITLDELQLAARNHGMPLEALRWTLTPVGLNNAVQRVPVTVAP